MEGGCLEYPGASTVASQPLDRKTAPILGTRHTDETVEGRKMGMGGGKWGGGETLNDRSTKPLYKRSNSQILAVYKATTNHVRLHLWD